MPKLEDLQAGAAIPSRRYEPNEVDLFFYNAAIWNGHRIHYDAPYTKDTEGYPGVVVDGPLQGDWLAQVVTDWLGEDGTLLELAYSNRVAAYVGERLEVGGEIVSVEPESREVSLRLQVANDRGEITTPGEAKVRLN